MSDFNNTKQKKIRSQNNCQNYSSKLYCIVILWALNPVSTHDITILKMPWTEALAQVFKPR